MARVVFMGTPEFAVPTLEGLAEGYEVVTVVTPPDRRGGRGRRSLPSPVKEAARQLGLSVWQPKTPRRASAAAHLRKLAPEIVVVAAYGRMLSPEFLAVPPRGCLNIHPSLLPKYRGPEPVAAAILAGDAETGVTLMLMDEGMDTGPIVAQRSVPIDSRHTRPSLTEELSHVGAQLLLETVPLWLGGEIEAQPQDDALASYAPLLSKEDGEIDWSLPAAVIERTVRAYTPWPGTYTHWHGQRLKVVRTQLSTSWRGEAGRVMETAQGLVVLCGEGALLLEEVQPAGKRSMPTAAFVRGNRHFVGARLPS